MMTSLLVSLMGQNMLIFYLVSIIVFVELCFIFPSCMYCCGIAVLYLSQICFLLSPLGVAN